MDLGLHYWNFSILGDPQRIADTLAAAAQTAEKAGFAEFSVMDHYGQCVFTAYADGYVFPPDCRC
jgi:alkanesulfonate monooxygenase SsuD/methylene tetrahydromethanopterin reductase-like flavin-dependent oxidoreductase (luciferase family)